MDKLTKTQRSSNMRAVKSFGSVIENLIAKALFAQGLRYRKNNETVFGKPDLTFKKYKIAIFVDSEFWHGHNWEIAQASIKSNRDFWINKIERNIARDIEVNQKLQDEGWTVIRFWGKDIKKNLSGCVQIVKDEIEKVRDGNKE